MDRKEFFSALGISAASAAVLTCIGCSKGGGSTPVVPPPTGTDFTLDLTLPANAPLLQNGGSVSTQGVLVGRTTAGAYIAVQASCTHQEYPLVYQANSKRFYCNNHGSTFTEAGVVTQSPANSNLATYKTQLTGNSLRVYA